MTIHELKKMCLQASLKKGGRGYICVHNVNNKTTGVRRLIGNLEPPKGIERMTHEFSRGPCRVKV